MVWLLAAVVDVTKQLRDFSISFTTSSCVSLALKNHKDPDLLLGERVNFTMSLLTSIIGALNTLWKYSL